MYKINDILKDFSIEFDERDNHFVAKKYEVLLPIFRKLLTMIYMEDVKLSHIYEDKKSLQNIFSSKADFVCYFNYLFIKMFNRKPNVAKTIYDKYVYKDKNSTAYFVIKWLKKGEK